jgi:hypothetical protein
MPPIDIRPPVELDGKYYVSVIIGGQKMKPYGPFSGADAAEAVAEHLIRISRMLTSSRLSGGKHG